MARSTIFERSDLLGKRAAEAVAEAAEESLEAGVPIAYAENGTLYKEFPGGRREVIGLVEEWAIADSGAEAESASCGIVESGTECDDG